MNQPSSSTFNSKPERGLGLGWNVVPLLLIVGWTVAGLVAVDTLIAVAFSYPSDPTVLPSRLQSFFEYGQSTETALKRMTRSDPSKTAPITLAGWYDPLVVKTSQDGQTSRSAPTSAKPVVTIYGGSHSVRLAYALGRVSKEFSFRSIGAPGATSNWSYGAYLRDRKSYKGNTAVVLTFNTDLLPSITSFSPAIWNSDAPKPYTGDRFYVHHGKLGVIHAPYTSFAGYTRTLSDPTAWRHTVDFFAKNDPLFNSISFRASILDHSPLARLARRAYNTQEHKLDQRAVLDQRSFRPDSEAVKVGRAIIREFAARARLDGTVPIIYLVNNMGYSDVLFRALKPALDADHVPYVSSHDFVPPNNPNGYLPDSHFTDANDEKLAMALARVVDSARCNRDGVSTDRFVKNCSRAPF